ncbi:MAG: hypothetical protein KDD37_08105 [Bdellovibrionales bacterium]|nr:hypothetical protein [Bdellovibrionales bacterium]
MVLAKSILNNLQANLWQFGLNPSEWRIHFSKVIAAKQTENEISMKNIEIINNEDQNFYFNAEAIIEQKNQAVRANWQSVQVVGL